MQKTKQMGLKSVGSHDFWIIEKGLTMQDVTSESGQDKSKHEAWFLKHKDGKEENAGPKSSQSYYI